MCRRRPWWSHATTRRVSASLDRIDFRHGAVFAGSDQEDAGRTLDLIVANPPYIDPADRPSLPRDVADHEPAVALFAEEGGLAVIRAIVARAPAALSAGGWLLMEIGQGQAPAVRTLVDQTSGLTFIEIRQDLAGHPPCAGGARRYRSVPTSSPGRVRSRHNSAMDCLFCKIIAGQIPAAKVYEDDRLVAFADINPQAPMHLLVVPREHIPTLNDLDPAHDALIGEMLRRATALAASRGYSVSGFRTVFNCNADAGQTVFHIHLHVLGGRKFTWPPG